MPLVGFVAPNDPMWLSTLTAMDEELVSDSLVYRYDPAASPDGLRGSEGTFSMCTFWYVDALARSGRLREARIVFEKMLTYGNHLGLFSEEIGPTGEQLGNFPQAFSHLALINAAIDARGLARRGRTRRRRLLGGHVSTDDRRHVIVVGGGFAGLGCARALADHHDTVRVTLIDRNNYHQFQPLLYQVATSQLSRGTWPSRCAPSSASTTTSTSSWPRSPPRTSLRTRSRRPTARPSRATSW